MTKKMKSLWIMLIAIFMIGFVPAQAAGAAVKYNLEFTGEMKIIDSPDRRYPKEMGLEPTLKKDKNGIYTLTMYEGSEIELGIKSTKNLTVIQTSDWKGISVTDNEKGYLTIENYHFMEENVKSVKETITLQLSDERAYTSGKKRNPNLGKKYGSKVKFKVVVKSIPYDRLGSVVPDLNETQETYAGNWADVSSVQQFDYKGEGLAYAYIEGKNLKVKMPAGELSLAVKYPRLGDVISDKDGNFYVVWGNEGSKYTDQTVFISKYSPKGEHIKTTGFQGESVMGQDGNTKTPFAHGNCASAIGGDYLMVNYARSMYNGHQSNNVIGVRISDMSPVQWGSVWNIPYTSHSFNQSVIWSNRTGGFVYADHGDAYGRGFVITSNESEKLLFRFYLQSNANYNMYIVNRTFAQLGNLAETSKGVVLVGASVKSISENAEKEKQNLFMQIFDPTAREVSPSIFLGGETRNGATSTDINDNSNSPLTPVTDYGVHWLTDYTDMHAVAPQVVEADDRLVILWSTEEDTFYMVLSADGGVLTPASSLGRMPLNSFERPVYHDGVISWAAVMEGRLRVWSIKI